jgi:hypothetical protein
MLGNCNAGNGCEAADAGGHVHLRPVRSRNLSDHPGYLLHAHFKVVFVGSSLVLPAF